MGDRENLIAVLSKQETGNPDDSFMTSSEIRRTMGWSVKKTADRIRDLMTSGDLECEYIARINVCGIRSRYPGYRLARKDPDGE